MCVVVYMEMGTCRAIGLVDQTVISIHIHINIYVQMELGTRGAIVLVDQTVISIHIYIHVFRWNWGPGARSFVSTRR